MYSVFPFVYLASRSKNPSFGRMETMGYAVPSKTAAVISSPSMNFSRRNRVLSVWVYAFC